MIGPPAGDPFPLLDPVTALARRADTIALPSPVLDGWSSLCATEYSTAVLRLAARLATARTALDTAALALLPP